MFQPQADSFTKCHRFPPNCCDVGITKSSDVTVAFGGVFHVIAFRNCLLMQFQDGLTLSVFKVKWNMTLIHFGSQGAVSIRKTVLLGMAIPMLKIRRPTGRLIFNMGIPIPGKTVFYVETGPWLLWGIDFVVPWSCQEYWFSLRPQNFRSCRGLAYWGKNKIVHMMQTRYSSTFLCKNSILFSFTEVCEGLINSVSELVKMIDGLVLNTLQWLHNDHDSVSNHQPHDCLLKHLFRRRSKTTSKLRVTGLCVGNSPGPVNSPHKGPVTRKMFPFDDVIMGDKPLYDGIVSWCIYR